MNLNGLLQINIELTSRCNKNCWICARRRRDREENEETNYGDIDFDILKKISDEIPDNIVIALHNNGESLLYPRFGEAVKLFKEKNCITNLVTNGKLLLKKSNEIINNLDTLSISIFENDEEADKQFEILNGFLELKKDNSPFTTLRFIGNVNQDKYEQFKKYNCLFIKRSLHSSIGSSDYRNSENKKIKPMIPEAGICLDFLSHLAIDRFGDVSVCVRFDKNKELVLGNIKENTLLELWNSEKRLFMKKMHVEGKRNLIPYCGNKCEFYGVPTSC